MLNKKFLFLWKDNWLLSTFGKQKSFLDIHWKQIEKNIDFSVKNISQQDKDLYSNFVKEKGLLNRLDNDTSGYLYFAKNFETYKKYKILQNRWKIYKIYVADVFGDYKKFWKPIIAYPIMHHKFLKEKMII